MQREEGLGCQILSHFSATCDAQGEPKHRLDVLVIQLLEGRHREYGQRTRPEDFPKIGWDAALAAKGHHTRTQPFVPSAAQCGVTGAMRGADWCPDGLVTLGASGWVYWVTVTV